LKQGEIVAIGTPNQAITPENLRQVFDVEAVTIITPVGLQICLLSPSHTLVRSRDPTK
jgi:iron complex transport system ATP-binding protein